MNIRNTVIGVIDRFTREEIVAQVRSAISIDEISQKVRGRISKTCPNVGSMNSARKRIRVPVTSSLACQASATVVAIKPCRFLTKTTRLQIPFIKTETKKKPAHAPSVPNRKMRR